MANAALQAKPKEMSVETGIARKDSDAVADVLSTALADSFSLYLKTLGVHWNVVGPSFFGLHKLTEGQYGDLGAAIDAIAERIRALGHLAPAAFGGLCAAQRGREQIDHRYRRRDDPGVDQGQ